MSSPSLLADLKDALRGGERDYTEGPIRRAVILLAVPMMLEMVMESLFAIVDIFWVAKLGAAAPAAVGLTESLLTLVYALAIGLSIGVTALVARRIGEKEPEAASRAAAQSILLGLGIAVVLGVVGVLNAERLLALMGAAPEVIAVGSGYAKVMLGGEATVILLFLINAAFRGAGDAAIAMRVLWIANGINIILDPLLIFGIGPFPELGVTGAAIATTIGRGVGVALQVWALFRGAGRLSLRREHFRVDLGAMGTLLRLSATGTLQTSIGMLSWVLLVRLISTFGSAALAGYTIAFRILMFALMPAWGFSNSAATLVGQGLGARKPERAEESVWVAAKLSGAFLGLAGIAFFVFAGPIARAFTSDPAVLPVAITCLRIISIGFPLYALGMVLTQAFNGAGDAWTPTWLNLFCFWLWEIPLAWVLAKPFGLEANGAFWAITVAFSTMAVAAGVLFARGTWKTRQV